MISSILKRDIDAYADALRANSPLLARAKAGTLPPSSIGKYLASIYFLLTQTPVHLELASARAREVGAEDLARFFETKRAEEAGHEEWAEADLARIQATFGASASGTSPAAGMLELVRHTRAAISVEPHAYLAYILFAEYLTVVIGPEWIAALRTKCGVPESAMTSVSKHVELDKEHVLEGCAEIDSLVTDPNLFASLRAMLGGTMTRFSSFCEELAAA